MGTMRTLSAEERTRLLGIQEVPRLLARLSGPAIAGMLMNSMYNLVDTIFVGQGPGTLALAALAVCFPIQLFMLAVAQTVGIGSASIISRSLGAGNKDYAERVAGSSFATAAVMAVVLAAVGISLLDPLLRLFGASDQVLPYGRRYLSVILPGGVLFAVAVSSHNLVRSEGNTKIAMFSMMIGAGTNIALDPVMIFGLDMGIRGAAVATVIGQACSFLYLMRYFARGSSTLRIRASNLRPRLAIASRALRIGSASFARVSAGSLMAIAVNNTIMDYGENVHLAVLGVAQRLLIFLLMPMFGLVQGLQPVVGYNYGARLYARVRRAMKLSLGAGVCYMLLWLVVLEVFPHQALSLFSSDQELLKVGAPILRILVVTFPLIPFQVVGASFFQALGKALPALVLSASRRALFIVPLALLLPSFMGLRGVWFSFPIADVLATALTLSWFGHEARLMRRKERSR
ncbi:MATE family efflux transporter [Candidatus Fermentibacteria bacterium]|nr:MATE family efflux transporter [Candidatus Fermentibacteria bacterium]